MYHLQLLSLIRNLKDFMKLLLPQKYSDDNDSKFLDWNWRPQIGVRGNANRINVSHQLLSTTIFISNKGSTTIEPILANF